MFGGLFLFWGKHLFKTVPGCRRGRFFLFIAPTLGVEIVQQGQQIVNICRVLRFIPGGVVV